MTEVDVITLVAAAATLTGYLGGMFYYLQRLPTA